MSTAVKIIKPRTAITVTQAELNQVVALRHLIGVTRDELAAKESELIALLQGGASIEAGYRTASVEIGERRSVAWREIVERLKGVGYAENVLKHTKPTPTKPTLEIVP